MDRLDQLADWLNLHTEAIHGASPSTVAPPAGCLATQRDGRLFLHILDWPGGDLVLPNLEGKVRHANLVHNGLEIAFDDARDLELLVPHQYPISPAGGVVLRLPRRRPDVLVPVVELDVDLN
ncbi:hypothetical protein JOF29_002881 [Kribbella aluminosa]|uniref:Uncharacterized protein n=1 Tax=Kribbella aluminosa TaxID=416017 RepID=A0ABS4UJG4_9ACTN|nr:hypothetical protein [Kribbella aluminosa]